MNINTKLHEPDRDQLEMFLDATFRHAKEGYVSFRSFNDGDDKKFGGQPRIQARPVSEGFNSLVDWAVDEARRAANEGKRRVFCPPIATFKDGKSAEEGDIAEGLTLSLELDNNAQEGRRILEGILGTATVVVTSGGKWTNGDGSEQHDRLHTHWRLAVPARGKEEIAKLKRVRALAAQLLKSDPSGKPICHPFRWPGSFHRKGEPRLCLIEALRADAEIDLTEALRKLEAEALSPESSDNLNRFDFSESPPIVSETEIDGLISGITDPDRSAAFYQIVCLLCERGHTVGEVKEILESRPDSYPERYASRLLEEIVRVHSKWQQGQRQKDQQSAARSQGDDEVRAKYLLSARPVSYYEDFDRALELDWIVKGLFAKEHTSYLIAPPGGGKSALFSSVATYLGGDNKEWRGFKIPRQYATVIFPLERGSLVKKRIWAESEREGFGNVPVAVSPGILNLMNPKCVDEMVGTILRAEDRFGLEAALINIDTFGKAIAAGGGDEDKAKDQNPAWGNIRRLHDAMARWHGIHVNAIGHTGKDQTRGARGSNAAEGDNDLLLQIKAEGPIKTVHVIKANELSEGPLLNFKMAPFDTGKVDDEGNVVEVWILDSVVLPLTPGSNSKKPLSRNQTTAYRILYEAGRSGLSQAQWGEQLREVGIGIKRHADFYDIRLELRDRRLVRSYGDRWYVDHKSEDPN